MKIYDSIQGSENWLLERSGHFSASCCNELLMKKTNLGYIDLINRIAVEKITGKPVDDNYKSYDMIRGNELEPEARRQYELDTFERVQEIGFMELNYIVGCSLDGIIGKRKIIEIKNKKYNTHTRLLNGIEKIPKKDILQIHFQLYVVKHFYEEINECIYYCYYPGIKPFIQEFDRDENIISEIRTRLKEAIIEVNEKTKQFERD